MRLMPKAANANKQPLRYPVFSTSELQHRERPVDWYRLVDPLLKVTVVWCIFSFKIFLVRFGEAGLRPDDLLILASFAALAIFGQVRRTPVSLPLKLYLVYTAVGLLSAVWNAWQGRVGLVYSLVFVTRMLEYVCFYFIGYALARSRFRLVRVVTWYLYLLCVLVPLQIPGWIPVPGDLGHSRASGNTNGPYELAVVCCFLLCYVGYRKRNFWFGAVSLVLLVLTASRITLIATVVSLIHFAVTRTRSIGKVIALTTALLLVGGGLYVLYSSGLVRVGAFERLQHSNSLDASDARAVYDAAPVAKNATEYMQGSFQDLNGFDTVNFDGDLSGLIRFTRWLTLLKTNLAHMDSIIIGLGPSFGSAAVDGYYTRCYVETGALGMLAFLAFLIAMLFTRRGSNWYFRDYVLIMIISAIFIDVFLSYKCMMLLWLWHGMNQYRRRKPSEASAVRSRKPTLPLDSLHEGIPSTGALNA
jgi:hypothetical protein